MTAKMNKRRRKGEKKERKERRKGERKIKRKKKKMPAKNMYFQIKVHMRRGRGTNKTKSKPRAPL